MPYSDEILLMLIGGIITYFIKSWNDNTEIKKLKSEIDQIREALIRAEKMKEDISTLKRDVDILFNFKTKILITLAKNDIKYEGIEKEQ
jgi:hypothetical protein